MKRCLILLLILCCSIRCRRVDAVVEDPARQRAETLLATYLRIDTTNPPGNETAAARYLQSVLREGGVESRLVGSDPARQSIWARLESGSKEPALLLLHHLDVVAANPKEWSMPPFGASISGGYMWGRGALDIKSLGIAQLLAVLELSKSGARLRRDVVFLGVADEEGGGLEGCKKLLEQQPELFANVGFVLNEGGANETIVDKVSFWGIEVTQKIPLWLRLTVSGSGGHAAVPPDDGGSVGRLMAVLEAIDRIPRPYRLIPSAEREFQTLALAKRGIKREIMRDLGAWLTRDTFEKEFPPSYRSLLRDTLVITQIHSGSGVNSVPSRAQASLDLRLLPDRSPDHMLQEIRKVVGGRAVIEILLKGEQVPDSPADTDLFQVMVRAMKKAEPGAVVGPIISPGTTDSRFFRARGIVAYGVSPFKVNYYDAGGVHGIDERIRLGFFHEGVALTRQIVGDFCLAR